MQTHLAVIFSVLLVTQFDHNSAKPSQDLYEKEYVIQDAVKVNFFGALRMCFNQDMRLATITSKEEDDKLKALINDSLAYPNQGYRYWTSGSELGNEGTYYWLSSGKPVTYHNWAEGEPSRVFDNKTENCLEVWNKKGTDPYFWNDAPCLLESFYICERFNDILY